MTGARRPPVRGAAVMESRGDETLCAQSTPSSRWTWFKRIEKAALGDKSSGRPPLQAIHTVALMRARAADDDGSSCFPSVTGIARRGGLKYRTVVTVDVWLQDRGFLEVVRTLPQNLTEYRLTVPTVTPPGEQPVTPPGEQLNGAESGAVAPPVVPPVTPPGEHNQQHHMDQVSAAAGEHDHLDAEVEVVAHLNMVIASRKDTPSEVKNRGGFLRTETPKCMSLWSKALALGDNPYTALHDAYPFHQAQQPPPPPQRREDRLTPDDVEISEDDRGAITVQIKERAAG